MIECFSITENKLDDNMKNVAISLFDDSNANLLIDQDNADWDECRLIISVNKCLEKSLLVARDVCGWRNAY